jgi:hypothetical protein
MLRHNPFCPPALCTLVVLQQNPMSDVLHDYNVHPTLLIQVIFWESTCHHPLTKRYWMKQVKTHFCPPLPRLKSQVATLLENTVSYIFNDYNTHPTLLMQVMFWESPLHHRLTRGHQIRREAKALLMQYAACIIYQQILTICDLGHFGYRHSQLVLK